MLRAAVLHSLLRRIQRFSTSSRPEALVACYVAPWRLPRPDFHRLADDSFQDTPASCQAESPTLWDGTFCNKWLCRAAQQKTKDRQEQDDHE
jgi:hypothetical protein